MSNIALLISEQRVKQLTNLDENVRVQEITPFVIQSQDLYLQPRLGTKFYDRLKEGVINSDLDTDEQALLNDYIAPMLANYAVYLILPGLKYKLVDKGVLSGASETTDSTSLEELEYLRQSFLDTAEFYDQRLFEHLCDVPTTMFPFYTNPGTDGMDPDHSSAYFSGLQIPQNYGKACNCGTQDYCNCATGGWIE